MQEGFDFDVIDAHFYYPDGVAAALIARKLGKPFVCTARGSDINLYRHFATPQRLIRRTLQQASANLGVSADLVRQLIELGADPGTAHVMRNGVDLDRFEPMDRLAARASLGLAHQGLLLLSVGNHVELKGHDLVIRMLQVFPQAHLVLVGDGPLRRDLQTLAESLGVAQRVTFAGQRPNDQLKTYYSAADVLLLASSREGWPNVLLESMACGTPVVATRVNGTPEIVTVPQSGRLAAAPPRRPVAALPHDPLGVRNAVAVLGDERADQRVSGLPLQHPHGRAHAAHDGDPRPAGRRRDRSAGPDCCFGRGTQARRLRRAAPT
jgi:glycosyltransferase involved in cell wall biosynthesis